MAISGGQSITGMTHIGSSRPSPCRWIAPGGCEYGARERLVLYSPFGVHALHERLGPEGIGAIRLRVGAMTRQSRVPAGNVVAARKRWWSRMGRSFLAPRSPRDPPRKSVNAQRSQN
jgi:hypothetical protein